MASSSTIPNCPTCNESGFVQQVNTGENLELTKEIPAGSFVAGLEAKGGLSIDITNMLPNPSILDCFGGNLLRSRRKFVGKKVGKKIDEWRTTSYYCKKCKETFDGHVE